jgi:hypothetical protein
MPLQTFISEPPLRLIDKLAQSGHVGAQTLSTYWVGQGVGLMNESLTTATVVRQFKEDFVRASERLTAAIGA